MVSLEKVAGSIPVSATKIIIMSERLKKLRQDRVESFFQWSIGIVFILIMLVVASLPYLAIKPENIFTKGLTIILCLFFLFIEIMVIGLMFSKVRDSQ